MINSELLGISLPNISKMMTILLPQIIYNTTLKQQMDLLKLFSEESIKKGLNESMKDKSFYTPNNNQNSILSPITVPVKGTKVEAWST